VQQLPQNDAISLNSIRNTAFIIGTRPTVVAVSYILSHTFAFTCTE
jgi:hypothetical protein